VSVFKTANSGALTTIWITKVAVTTSAFAATGIQRVAMNT
jgi:hypothetical protein